MLILPVTSSSSRTVGGQRSKIGLSECNTLSAGGSWDPPDIKVVGPRGACRVAWGPETPRAPDGWDLEIS